MSTVPSSKTAVWISAPEDQEPKRELQLVFVFWLQLGNKSLINWAMCTVHGGEGRKYRVRQIIRRSLGLLSPSPIQKHWISRMTVCLHLSVAAMDSSNQCGRL